MNKKSAFQWGRRIRTGVAKIDAGNIAGLGGVMRVLVVVERGAAPTLLSSSRRAANIPAELCLLNSPVHKTSLFPLLFYPESDFSAKKSGAALLSFFYFLQPWLWLSFHLIFSPFTTHIK